MPQDNLDDSFSAKPWSSGRVLSSAQRERKRRMNRVSQLRRREKRKDSLKDLEDRLFNMEQSCLAFLPSVSNREDPPIFLTPIGNSTNVSSSAKIHKAAPVSFANNTTPVALSLCQDNNGMGMRDSLYEILTSVHHFNYTQLCRDDQFNQDALIRGVILGWGVLQIQYFSCPVWDILRRIDALLVAHTAVATRLALLRGVHLMLLARCYPDRPPPLPPWFKPREFSSQTSSPNAVISDYFAWPRFREKLLGHDYPPLTNRFWLYFVRNVQFEWPFSPAHTIEIDKDSGKYHFSMNWRDTMDVIQRFTMGPEFFNAYPDCYGDI